MYSFKHILFLWLNLHVPTKWLSVNTDICTCTSYKWTWWTHLNCWSEVIIVILSCTCEVHVESQTMVCAEHGRLHPLACAVSLPLCGSGQSSAILASALGHIACWTWVVCSCSLCCPWHLTKVAAPNSIVRSIYLVYLPKQKTHACLQVYIPGNHFHMSNVTQDHTVFIPRWIYYNYDII